MKYRWVGEKYDGIRCCWHPERQILYLYKVTIFFNYENINNQLKYNIIIFHDFQKDIPGLVAHFHYPIIYFLKFHFHF